MVAITTHREDEAAEAELADLAGRRGQRRRTEPTSSLADSRWASPATASAAAVAAAEPVVRRDRRLAVARHGSAAAVYPPATPWLRPQPADGPAATPWPLDDGRPHGRHLPDRATRVRRRRLAVLVVAVLVVLAVVGAVRLATAVSVGGSSGPEPISTGRAPVAGQTYVVRQGDTLWSIAEEIAPDSDPRPVVDALRNANGGATLEVGTRLMLDID
jgi:nucleoid-associated protein YgaU